MLNGLSTTVTPMAMRCSSNAFTYQAVHNTPLVTLRWTDRDAIEPVAMAAD